MTVRSKVGRSEFDSKVDSHRDVREGTRLHILGSNQTHPRNVGSEGRGSEVRFRRPGIGEGSAQRHAGADVDYAVDASLISECEGVSGERGVARRGSSRCGVDVRNVGLRPLKATTTVEVDSESVVVEHRQDEFGDERDLIDLTIAPCDRILPRAPAFKMPVTESTAL